MSKTDIGTKGMAKVKGSRSLEDGLSEGEALEGGTLKDGAVAFNGLRSVDGVSSVSGACAGKRKATDKNRALKNAVAKTGSFLEGTSLLSKAKSSLAKQKAYHTKLSINSAPLKGHALLGAKQTTLAAPLQLTGVGVHSGAPVSITLYPAEVDYGIRFAVDGADGSVEIKAHRDWVKNLTLCTVLGSECGALVATVEHLMAALRGLSIDNVLVDIDSGEVPIMDGSALPFVQALDEVGLVELEAPRRFIKVLKPVRVEENGCWGELLPYNGFRLDVEIDFDSPAIGRQRFVSDLNPGVFRQELAKARTFGFMADVENLWAAGRALGASLENTVAIDQEHKVLNGDGLRFADEFVRHKALDAVGDLALSGQPLLCCYQSYRGGHALNAKVLEALFADDEAWVLVDAPMTDVVLDKPAAELRPDLSSGGGAAIAAANFAADRS